MIHSLEQFHHPFFVGIAGSGMSGIAQYLQGIGKKVSGSDRFFIPDEHNDTREKLMTEGIRCFEQNGSGIQPHTDLIIASTAVEDNVPEIIIAKEKGIPILRRAELLALIANNKKTIAIGGTSGKSTTCGMLFTILEEAGMQPGIITGAGLIQLMEQGKTGNVKVGNGDWLIIEADESDGSIVQYKPAIGLLLNIDKDHQEIAALMEIFATFKNNSQQFIVNQSHALAATLSCTIANDFATDTNIHAGIKASGFRQSELQIFFLVNDIPFELSLIGAHNMENAVAATAVANAIGIDLSTCAAALRKYKGIYRRNQIYGNKNGVLLIDDFAHNPVKCAAAIKACHPLAQKTIAWLQPHGYGPTRFLREDFVLEITNALRLQDEIWMSEIFYAGGTAAKDISAVDLINDIRANGKNAFFVADRNELLPQLQLHFSQDCVLLLMGARDPSLEDFAKTIWENL